MDRGRGSLVRVINNDAEVPDHPDATFTGFRHSYIADNGLIVFEGSYELGGVIVKALYAKREHGPKVNIVVDQLGEDLALAPRFAAVGEDGLKVAYLHAGTISVAAVPAKDLRLSGMLSDTP